MGTKWYHRRVTEQQLEMVGVDAAPESHLRVAGLFAGIGGIELGLHEAGHRTEMLCEFDPAARAVLAAQFPELEIFGDVRELTGADFPEIDLLAGGFPCQDLSQAGKTAGIAGERSGLVRHMFRLLDELDAAGRMPTWLMVENVLNMLSLDGGRAMHYLVEQLRARRLHWAYRVVDSQAFGLPQRRQRVILLASRTADPRRVLFADDAGEPTPTPEDEHNKRGHGFYWTEGIRGLGWAPGAIPTLKGGSAVGIPSPPAVWMPDGRFVVPGIEDAEALQGFPRGWTGAGEAVGGRGLGPRWKLVGNAVSVPVASWVGRRLCEPGRVAVSPDRCREFSRWPMAAAGEAQSQTIEVYPLSVWPIRRRPRMIARFLRQAQPLSLRAASGFRERTFRAKLNLSTNAKSACLRQLDAYIEGLGGDVAALEAISDEKVARSTRGAVRVASSGLEPGARARRTVMRAVARVE